MSAIWALPVLLLLLDGLVLVWVVRRVGQVAGDVDADVDVLSARASELERSLGHLRALPHPLGRSVADPTRQ